MSGKRFGLLHRIGLPAVCGRSAAHICAVRIGIDRNGIRTGAFHVGGPVRADDADCITVCVLDRSGAGQAGQSRVTCDDPGGSLSNVEVAVSAALSA